MAAKYQFLITGTDTGVGKTTVACSLAALFRRRGMRVGVMKPAETGCVTRDGEMIALDALASGPQLYRMTRSRRFVRIATQPRWRPLRLLSWKIESHRT